MAYTKYSLTPANNTAAPPDGAPEGMLPSAVNDTMRDMMAQIRDCGDGIRDGTYTMTAPKITGGTITGATFAAGTVSLPSITTTGDTNTGIYFPAADTIAFTEGGVESVRIDASGNVGIGNAIPSTFNSFANNLVIGNGSSDEGLTIYTGTTNVGTLNFADGTTGSDLFQGYIQYVHSSDEMRFFVNYAGSASFRMSINSNGGVQAANSISVGNATPTTSGAGITFPATQSASSDANTLDDYEEGSFTPSWSSTGASFTYDASYRHGRYTKIGNRVYFSIYIGTTIAPSGTTSNALSLSGLPFTSAAVNNGSINAVYFGQLWNVDWPANKNMASAYVSTSTSSINLLWEQDSTVSSNWVADAVLASCYVLITGFYETT